MRKWIRKLLGLNELEHTLVLQMDSIRQEIFLLRNELVVTFNDELSPKRKAISDELEQRMRDKLIAEDKARRHTLGES